MRKGTTGPAERAKLEADLRNRGLERLLDAPALKRLEGVSFLSVLDYVYDVATPSNRLEHSIGVAHLALQVADRFEMGRSDLMVFVIANLLHDIGHVPFSHNSEPFLLEQRNLYHQGLTTALLRRGRSSATGSSSISDILDSFYSDLKSAVMELLVKRSSSNRTLSDLFVSPVNCDKLEGNDRTLKHLDLPSMAPGMMLDCLLHVDGQAYVKRQDLQQIERFWKLEEDVYWTKIYTSSVFAAEAMVTRALEQVYKTPEELNRFIESTDDEVREDAQHHSIAAMLLERVRSCDLFSSLSESRPEICARFRERLVAVRFEKAARQDLEAEIAAEIGVPSRSVISHFSRRKHFPTEMSHVAQISFFEDDSRLVPLQKVNSTFSALKVSGDFFDIFYSDSL